MGNTPLTCKCSSQISEDVREIVPLLSEIKTAEPFQADDGSVHAKHDGKEAKKKQVETTKQSHGKWI